MNKELIPIIAAYWGCDMDFKVKTKSGRSALFKMDEYTICVFGEKWRRAKLHLRPLWSITEIELMELGEVVPFQNYTIRTNKLSKEMTSGVENELVLGVGNDGGFTTNQDYAVLIINHLRSKGFCVDQCLIDAGLVQWKEVTNG